MLANNNRVILKDVPKNRGLSVSIVKNLAILKSSVLRSILESPSPKLIMRQKVILPSWLI